jgi:hypothetical protein
MTVTNFGNPHVIAGLPWYFAMSLVMQGTVSTLVQVSHVLALTNEGKLIILPLDVLHLPRIQDLT